MNTPSVLTRITESLQMENAVHCWGKKKHQPATVAGGVQSVQRKRREVHTYRSCTPWVKVGFLEEQKCDQWGHWQGSCSARLCFQFPCIRSPFEQWFSTFHPLCSCCSLPYQSASHLRPTMMDDIDMFTDTLFYCFTWPLSQPKESLGSKKQLIQSLPCFQRKSDPVSSKTKWHENRV